MRRFALLAAAAAILSVGAVLPSNAEAGYYRIGETGYTGIIIAGVLVGSTRTIASAGTAIVGTVEVSSLPAATTRCLPPTERFAEQMSELDR